VKGGAHGLPAFVSGLVYRILRLLCLAAINMGAIEQAPAAC